MLVVQMDLADQLKAASESICSNLDIPVTAPVPKTSITSQNDGVGVNAAGLITFPKLIVQILITVNAQVK